MHLFAPTHPPDMHLGMACCRSPCHEDTLRPPVLLAAPIPKLFPAELLPSQAVPSLCSAVAWSVPGSGRGRWVHVDGSQEAQLLFVRDSRIVQTLYIDEAANLKFASFTTSHPPSNLLQALIKVFLKKFFLKKVVF